MNIFKHLIISFFHLLIDKINNLFDWKQFLCKNKKN